MQTSIERHNVISEIESKINQIFSSPIAKRKNEKGELETIMVRTVLDDESPWMQFNKEIKPLIIDQQRYICIRKEPQREEYISTQALHEILIVSRRVEKLYKDGIIKRIDLADLWREFLPLILSNRIGFLSTYYSIRDVDSLLYVGLQTIISCHKIRLNTALEYFRKSLPKEEIELLNLLKNNQRLRLIDKFSVFRYKALLRL